MTVLRLADTGALAAVEVAKRKRKRILRFRPEAVEKFVASREQKRNGKGSAEALSDAGRHSL